MAGDVLDVWLYGTLIGRLNAPRFGRLRFEPAAEALDRWGRGSTIVSLSLPLDDVRPNNDRTLRFFDGLLPESNARSLIEQRFGLRRGDTIGLLAALGRDSAGALLLLPPGSSVDEAAGSLEPYDDDGLIDALAHLDTRPLGVDDRVRVSLTGQQGKLVVGRLPDGRWARPVDGAASTHLLKPEDVRFPGYAANEVYCLHLARQIDLTSVDAEIIELGSMSTAAISRYDRVVSNIGRVERLHQEDTCQALSVDCVTRDRKYQRDGGPSLRAIARLLDRHAAADDVRRFARCTVFNAAIGNADAHGRNFSLVHGADGTCSLAPMYDVACLLAYEFVETTYGHRPVDHDAAMSINGAYRLVSVGKLDLVGEIRAFGLGADAATDLVETTLADLAAALATVSIPRGAERVADLIAARVARLRAE